MPQGTTLYARTYKDRLDWGPLVSFELAWEEFLALPYQTWDLQAHVLDLRTTLDFAQYFVEYPFPRLTDPREPAPTFDDEDD